MVLQNYQNFIEMTANMIYIVALCVGLKCPCKIHLNTQCGEGRLSPPITTGTPNVFHLSGITVWFKFGNPKVTVHKCAETLQGRKLFKGGNYMRKYGIYFTTVKTFLIPYNHEF